jgi:hypothetical protein
MDISNLVSTNIGSIFKIAGIKLSEMSVTEAWNYSIDISDIELNKKDLEIIREFR